VPGVRSYITVRACLLAFIARASHVRQHLGVVHRRAPSVHGVIERVLLQTEQHAGVVFMVLTAVYTQRARGLSTVVAIWLGTYPVTYPAAVSGQQRLDRFCHFDMTGGHLQRGHGCALLG
jgi:hypothetical protein